MIPFAPRQPRSQGFPLVFNLRQQGGKSPGKISFNEARRARLAQSVEHQTFNLRVMGSSPISGESLFCSDFLFLKTILTFFTELVFHWRPFWKLLLTIFY